ncbi:MAG: putative toxin-antitoxin system toxin component, PIN family [Acidobacteriota bacterium]
MNIVLDTNVLISGIFFSGIPGRILAAWAVGRFDLLATVEILIEYRRVAERLHDEFPAVEVKGILDLITQETRIIEPVSIPATACDDPDDLKFLSCALAGRADYVISGDRALLRASGFQGLRVVTPREFARSHLKA